jgi:hypothetical protein
MAVGRIGIMPRNVLFAGLFPSVFVNVDSSAIFGLKKPFENRDRLFFNETQCVLDELLALFVQLSRLALYVRHFQLCLPEVAPGEVGRGIINIRFPSCKGRPESFQRECDLSAAHGITALAVLLSLVSPCATGWRRSTPRADDKVMSNME